jgi:hypothetical protein
MYHITPASSHDFIAKCCLAYLKRFQTKSSMDSDDPRRETELKYYAAKHCYDHCKAGGVDVSSADMGSLLGERTTVLNIQRSVASNPEVYLASLVAVDQTVKMLEKVPGTDMRALANFCYHAMFTLERVSLQSLMSITFRSTAC